MNTLEMLKKLGMTAAAGELQRKQELKRKLAMAYEFYRYVRPAKVKAFNKKLYEQTVKRQGKAGADLVEKFDRLAFVPLSAYAQVPPAEALTAIAEAQERGCFDAFEVCKVESTVEYKDPIVFGRIRGCADRFFICQWDDDVKITDLLGEREG